MCIREAVGAAKGLQSREQVPALHCSAKLSLKVQGPQIHQSLQQPDVNLRLSQFTEQRDVNCLRSRPASVSSCLTAGCSATAAQSRTYKLSSGGRYGM